MNEDILSINENVLIQGARSMRLAFVQNFYDRGELTEEEAKEILSGPLTPGDDSSIYDDSEMLQVKLDPKNVCPCCGDIRIGKGSLIFDGQSFCNEDHFEEWHSVKMEKYSG